MVWKILKLKKYSSHGVIRQYLHPIHTHSHIELLQYHNTYTHTYTQNCCNITIPTHTLTHRTVAIALSVWIGTIFEYATMTTRHVTPVTLELDEGLPVLFQFFSFYLVETLSDSPTRKQINIEININSTPPIFICFS